jgi:peptide/nickel transport system ATP-binding protein
VKLDGEELLTHGQRDAAAPAELQIIFQDPYASLNPRLTAGDIVAEPLRNFGGRTRPSGASACSGCSRASACAPRRRRNIRTSSPAASASGWASPARWRCNPKLIVCDEPVSALDVSVQAQVVNLLMDLQEEFGIAYLFVAHDLAVVRHISHRVAVMYLGHIVEVADRDTLFSAPRHPYTEILLSAVPVPNPRTPRAACCCRATRPARQPADGLPLPHPLPAGAAGVQAEAGPEPARTPRSHGEHWVACHFR